jgi:hypothetical protein
MEISLNFARLRTIEPTALSHYKESVSKQKQLKSPAFGNTTDVSKGGSIQRKAQQEPREEDGSKVLIS